MCVCMYIYIHTYTERERERERERDPGLFNNCKLSCHERTFKFTVIQGHQQFEENTLKTHTDLKQCTFLFSFAEQTGIS